MTEKKLVTFMRMARELSALSTCKRKPCGAMLIAPDFSEVLAVGYNGPPSGHPNSSCPGTKPCGCMHAEANCLVKARRSSAVGLLLLVTRAPCAYCAGLILNSRAIGRVVFAEESSAWSAGGKQCFEAAGKRAPTVSDIKSLAGGAFE